MYQSSFQENPGSIPPAAYITPNIAPLSYEQRVNYFYIFRKQQKEFIERRLKESYPVKFVIVYGILMTLHSIAQIVLHILLILNNGANYRIYHGIWGGGLCLFLPFFALLLIKFRNIHIYRAASLTHMIGATGILIGIILASSFGLMEYERYYSKRTKTYSSSANREMMPVTIAMLVLAALAFVLALVYLILIGRILRKPVANVSYNQNGASGPINLSINNPVWLNGQNFQDNSFNNALNAGKNSSYVPYSTPQLNLKTYQ